MGIIHPYYEPLRGKGRVCVGVSYPSPLFLSCNQGGCMQDLRMYSKTFTDTEVEVENDLNDLEDREFVETELNKRGCLD
jgi:hypothetical protein